MQQERHPISLLELLCVDWSKEIPMKRIALAALFVIAGIGQASAQDAAAGEKVFAVCKACHQVGDNAKNAVGPVLNGLFGRKAVLWRATIIQSRTRNRA